MTVSALLTAEGQGGRMLEEAVSNLSLGPPPASGRGPPVSAVSWSVVPDPSAAAT
ncbi:hypothetical protein OTB20_20140 [Streptomyces sp. H27-H1]|uniref:hypothetical protein n=1 Tax=Streptomyces sp. H27-H1 TaxID=2996461 RepID=UPI00227007BD|nr:hypothetical protein [Streptomyces sp. H27-H1]MCY0928469.1 hypothetical protein [Streptomyces sp. H27-H1]